MEDVIKFEDVSYKKMCRELQERQSLKNNNFLKNKQ